MWKHRIFGYIMITVTLIKLVEKSTYVLVTVTIFIGYVNGGLIGKVENGIVVPLGNFYWLAQLWVGV